MRTLALRYAADQKSTQARLAGPRCDATRYNRIKAAVHAGEFKPSIYAIQTVEGERGEIVVRRYLHHLETDGVTVLAKCCWMLAEAITN